MKDIVIEYLERYPQLSKKQLSKQLHRDYPEVFNSWENARSTVRYYTGAHGERSRKYEDNRPLPKAQEIDRSPYIIPEECNRILILADTHIVFQDNEAIKIAVEYGHMNDINTILLNGDIFDFYAGSKYLKDPRLVDWKGELEKGREFFDYIKGEFPDSKIIFKVGNHEVRFEKYMMQNAPMLYQTNFFQLEDLIGLRERGIDCVSHSRIVKAGDLTILHGDETKMIAGGKHPAHRIYDKTHVSVLISHFHKVDNYICKDIYGNHFQCHTTGCLSNLSPDWLPYNDWELGFAVVYTNGNKFRVDNLRIVDDMVSN